MSGWHLRSCLKGSDDLLREMVGYIAQRLMGLDLTRLCTTGPDAR